MLRYCIVFNQPEQHQQGGFSMEEKKLLTTAVLWVKHHTQELMGTKEVTRADGTKEFVRAFEWESEIRGSKLFSTPTTDHEEAKSFLTRIRKPLDCLDYTKDPFDLAISRQNLHLRITVDLEAFYTAYYQNKKLQLQLTANFLNDVYDPSGSRAWKVLVDTSQEDPCFYLAYYTENLNLSIEDLHNSLPNVEGHNKQSFSFSLKTFQGAIKFQAASRIKDFHASSKKETQESSGQKNIKETDKRRFIIENKLFLTLLFTMTREYFPSIRGQSREKTGFAQLPDLSKEVQYHTMPTIPVPPVTKLPLGRDYGNAPSAVNNPSNVSSTYFSTQAQLNRVSSHTDYGNAPNSSTYFSTHVNGLMASIVPNNNNNSNNSITTNENHIEKEESKQSILFLHSFFKDNFTFSTGEWTQHRHYLEFKINKKADMKKAQQEITNFSQTILAKISPVIAGEFTNYLEEESGSLYLRDKQYLQSLHESLKNRPKESKSVCNEDTPSKEKDQKKSNLLSKLWSTKKNTTEDKKRAHSSNHSAEQTANPQETRSNSTPYQSFV